MHVCYEQTPDFKWREHPPRREDRRHFSRNDIKRETFLRCFNCLVLCRSLWCWLSHTKLLLLGAQMRTSLPAKISYWFGVGGELFALCQGCFRQGYRKPGPKKGWAKHFQGETFRVGKNCQKRTHVPKRVGQSIFGVKHFGWVKHIRERSRRKNSQKRTHVPKKSVCKEGVDANQNNNHKGGQPHLWECSDKCPDSPVSIFLCGVDRLLYVRLMQDSIGLLRISNMLLKKVILEKYFFDLPPSFRSTLMRLNHTFGRAAGFDFRSPCSKRDFSLAGWQPWSP